MDAVGARDSSISRLALICETGSAILETLDLDRILSVVAEQTRALFDGTGAGVAYLDPEMLELEVAEASGTLSTARGARYPLEGTLSEIAISENRPIIRNELPEEPFYESLVAGASGPRRALVVPLRARNGAIGTLAVVGKGGEEGFDETDGALLFAFGHLAGLAIQNARLLEAEIARARRSDTLRAEREDQIHLLQELHRAEVAVSSDLELEHVLQTVADKARELTGARYAALGVLGEDEESFDHFITSGISDAERAAVGEPPKGLGLLGAVMRSQEPIRVNDMRRDPRAVGLPGRHPEMESFLGVPIRTGERVFGNLYLTQPPKAGKFTDRDQAVVSMLAAHAAVAIQNARQFRTLQRLLQELRATQQQRDRFYAFVNHDLRNACSGVLMWAERLIAKIEGDNREIAEKIRRGSEHAMRLVQDVLDLENIGQGRLEMWPRVVPVGELLHAAADAMRPEADEKGMKFLLSSTPADLRIVADPDRALQIVTNLLSNAVKYSPEGTEVRLEAELRDRGPDGDADKGAWAAISVIDQGPGIPEKDRERIFGEYVKGIASRTTQGMGIGLPLSRRLAEFMGGMLTVESAPGEGSTFTLWLPHDREPERRTGWIG